MSSLYIKHVFRRSGCSRSPGDWCVLHFSSLRSSCWLCSFRVYIMTSGPRATNWKKCVLSIYKEGCQLKMWLGYLASSRNLGELVRTEEYPELLNVFSDIGRGSGVFTKGPSLEEISSHLSPGFITLSPWQENKHTLGYQQAEDKFRTALPWHLREHRYPI